MKRIGDDRTRLATLDEAKEAMAVIAKAECDIAYAVALRDRQIQRAKARHALAVDKPLAKLEEQRTLLRDYIIHHKSEFKRPRKVSTQDGEFGLQRVSECVITNEETVLEALKEGAFHNAIKVVETPIKSEVRKLIEDNYVVPGARMRSGDTAVYKVNKARLDAVKTRAENQ